MEREEFNLFDLPEFPSSRVKSESFKSHNLHANEK
jgi:hypothetical protein